MKKILLISFSDIERDPRVNKQISCFSESYNLVVIGYGKSEKADSFYDVKPLLTWNLNGDTRREKIKSLLHIKSISTISRILFVKALLTKIVPLGLSDFLYHNLIHRKVINIIRKEKPDLIYANDLSALPFAIKAKGNSKVIFDAHEFYPGLFANTKKFRYSINLFEYQLSKYLKKVDNMVTVCEGIAKEYALRYKVNLPLVITNAPSFKEMKPQKVEKNIIKMVHHGLGQQRRGIEYMIKTVDKLDDRFCLHFYLVSIDKEYIQNVMNQVNNKSRIIFHDPVPMEQLSVELNKYDLGFYMLPPTCFNHLHALPNKLFEFVQARLGVAIWPSVEMKNLVEKFGLGIVSSEFTSDSMVNALTELDIGQIESFKKNSHLYALDLSSGPQLDMLSKLVHDTI